MTREMDREEVARMLGMTVSEVASIEARALAKMRVALGDIDDESRAIRPVKIADPFRARLAMRGICTWCSRARALLGRRMCASCNLRARESVRRSRARRAVQHDEEVAHAAE